MFKVREVSSRRDLHRFIAFPDRLYRDCPQYVPALHSNEVRNLTRLSTLSYCERKMWLLEDDGKVVGRICGMINPRYNERYGTERARFGWFDVIDDREAADMLLDTAEAWAREKGMTEIHGPLFYNTLGKQGLLVEGFDQGWFDTKGEFLSVQAASPVWKKLGRGALPKGLEWPIPDYDTRAIGDNLGYVRRDNGHGISWADWVWMLDFADRNLGL